MTLVLTRENSDGITRRVSQCLREIFRVVGSWLYVVCVRTDIVYSRFKVTSLQQRCAITPICLTNVQG